MEKEVAQGKRRKPLLVEIDLKCAQKPLKTDAKSMEVGAVKLALTAESDGNIGPIASLIVFGENRKGKTYS